MVLKKVDFFLAISQKMPYIILMIKTKRIEIRQWSKHINIAIFDLVTGGFPRVRSSSSQSHLNRILRQENANALNVELIHLDKRAI